MKTTDPSALLLERLAEVWEMCPEMRFGQVIATVSLLAEDAEDDVRHSLWEVEDTEFATALERFAQDLARRGRSGEQSGATDLGSQIGRRK